MKRQLLALVTLVTLSSLLLTNKTFAQVTLGASPYTQDFNSVGTGLPVGWTVRTGSTASALGTTVTLTTGATAWNNTAGAFKNFASATGLTAATITADQAAATNRALGVRQTGSFGDPGAAFVLQLTNTTGSSNFSLSFKLQSLDGGALARTASWVVDYGFGTTPASFTTVTTSPTSLSTTLSPAGWGSVDVTVNFGTALDNNSGNVWIRIANLSATTGSGSRPSTAIDDVQLSYSSGDVAPPSFTSGFPKISNFTTTGFDLVSNINESGNVYYVVLPDGASTPTSSQIKSGQDAGGNALSAGFFGTVSISAAATNFPVTLSALSASTDYDVYVAAEDLIPNLQTTPVKLDARTNTVGDVDAPLFTAGYPIIDQLNPTGFRLKASLNEQGRVYFVVLNDNALLPTSSQVKAGQDANGVALPANFAGTINVPVANTEFTGVVTGLTSDTPYRLLVVTEDNVPNLTLAPTPSNFRTGTLFAENFNVCDGAASFTQFSVSGDQVWECTDFGRGSVGIRMNGFAVTAQLNEDWLISPAVNLKSNPSMSFYSQFSFAGNPLKLMISTNYSGSGSPSAATWTDMNAVFPTVAVGSSSTSLADWTLTNVDLANYPNQKVYLAFVYTSTTSAAARWTLDDVTFNNASASYLQIVPAGITFKASGAINTFVLKGYDLQNQVVVTAPANFQVSKDNVTYGSSVTYTAAEANAQKTVYVKFSVPGIVSETYSGTISVSSDGVSSETIVVSGKDLTKTFDVTTYNLEFFGTDVKDTGGTEFGPTNDALQVANVTTVMQTIQSDIFAVEEVADDAAFDQLVAGLPGYDKLLANRWSYSFDPADPNFPPQKIGFIYNTSTVTKVSQRVMFEKFYDDVRLGNVPLPNYPGGTPSSFWSSGRLPFMVTFDVTINGSTKRVRMIDIHAKSGSAQADYDRRKFDIQVLYDSLNANYPNDNIILLGDFNDDVEGSINVGATSTYKPFVDDHDRYNVLTYQLTLTSAGTFPSSNSFLDHIITSNELTNSYVANSITIEDPRNYISNYSNTTSDHLPVTARFVLKNSQTITFNAPDDKTFGEPAFALTATASSNLAVAYTTTSDKITIAGSQVTLVKPGRVTVTANQAGNENFTAASPVDRSFCIKPSKPTITISNLNTASPILTSSASTGNQWYVNGSPIIGSTNNTLNVTTPGIYKVQVLVDDCVSAFSSDTPIIVTGDLDSGSRISVYPNPVIDFVEIRGIQDDVPMSQVVDMLGKTSAISLQKNGDAHRGSVQHLTDGVYLLRIQDGPSVHQIKLIKK